MRSTSLVSGVCLAFAGTAAAVLYKDTSNLNHTCVLSEPLLSCATGVVAGAVDTCCAETYGGLLLNTQFWSTYTGLEKEGQVLPKNSWTLHGLWPDFCNGSYTQYCDLSRQYDPEPSPNTTNGLRNGTVVPPYNGTDIGSFLEAFGKYDLLAWMKKYWIAQAQPNWYFWAHEFSKHATCFSTFDIPCYGPKYQVHEDVVDFFETAILYFNELPTFKWLSHAGIKPSNSTSYTLADFQKVLTAQYGATPYIGCSGPRYNATAAGSGTMDNGRTVLSEVWYYSHVYGRPQEGNTRPVNATGSNTSCARAVGAVLYPERTKGSEK